MRPVLLKHEVSSQETAFKIWKNANPYQHNPWHFHPEIEITYIEKDEGTRFVGDSIQPYWNDDLVVLGSNLPHEWRSNFFRKDNENFHSQSMAVHFLEEFPGGDFYAMPEAADLRAFLETSRRGIKVNDLVVRKKVKQKLVKMHTAPPFHKVLLLFSILDVIIHAADNELLASRGFVESFCDQQGGDFKINRVYEYTIVHFKEPITIDTMADLVSMTPNAFCRYFKKSTNKVFTVYLSELRIGYACKFLIEQQYSISQIAFECGFRNISNFNKQFRSVTGKTPTEYIRHFLTV
jgi:AraC-like DNA-binding protein